MKFTVRFRQFVSISACCALLLGVTGCESKPASSAADSQPSPSATAPEAATAESEPSKSSPTAPVETPSSATPSPETQPAYVGQWKAASAVVAGNAFPEPVLQSIELRLTKDTYEALVGPTSDKGTCAVDAAATPGKMTIVGTEGPNAGKTILAIFEMVSPTEMRVAYDLSGKEFPTVFESTAENNLYVATYVKK